MVGSRNTDKAKRFTFLFIIFIIGVTFYGPVSIGLITIRNLVTLLMLMTCIIYYKGMWIDRMFLTYIVFVCFYMISVLLDPYSNPTDFFSSKLFGYYLPCYVAYFATYVYFIKLGQSPKPLIITLLITGSLSAIVSILQFLQLNNIWQNVYSILLLPLPNYLSNLEDYNLENTLGYITSGLFQKAVANGYFLCMTSLLSFFLLRKHTNIRFIILFFLLWLINFTGLFVCQERAAFILGVLGSIFLFFGSMRRSIPLSFLFFCVVLLLVFQNININTENLGRFSDMSFSNREDINNNSINFLSSNLLLGGIAHYQHLYHIPPHNLFFNVFIYSGIFGGLILLWIFFRQCWVCCKNSLLIKKNYELVVISIVLLAYQGNSFAHNLSLATGDVTIWLLWGVIIFGYCHNTFTTITRPYIR